MRAPSDLIEVNVYDGNQLVATGKSINDEAVVIPMPEDAKLWSPDFPFLYTLKVMLKSFLKQKGLIKNSHYIQQ